MAVVGPTASGKTALSVDLAERFGGEIVNADSRQVYRHMDIGTAKPSPEERQRAPHHLLDAVAPDEDFSLGTFLASARDIIKDVTRRGGVPLLVGGSGQYIWALLEGWDVPAVPPDPVFRQELKVIAEHQGPDTLHRRLADVDPQRAAAIDPRNVRRVIRALEVHHHTGVEPSRFRPRLPNAPPSLVIGLTAERGQLYQRIDLRVDAMMSAGFLAEVESLLEMGYSTSHAALNCPGYRELGEHLAGECSLDDAVGRTKYRTHRMARRQYTWFKPSDRRIHWLETEAPDVAERASGLVESFLNEHPPVVQ